MVEAIYYNKISKKAESISKLLMAFYGHQNKDGLLNVVKTNAFYRGNYTGVHYSFDLFNGAEDIVIYYFPGKKVNYNFTVESVTNNIPQKEFNNLAQAQDYLISFFND